MSRRAALMAPLWLVMACGAGPAPPERGGFDSAPPAASAVAAHKEPTPVTPASDTRKTVMTEEEATPIIAAAVAKAAEVAADTVSVDISDAEVPGGYVFRYEIGEEPRRGSYGAGALLDGKVILKKKKATRAVMAALGGADAEAMAVAEATGVLQGAVEPAYPVLMQDDIDVLKKAWRPHLFLPRKTQAGFAFWVTSGEPPAWRVELALKDGKVTVKTEDIWALAEQD